MIRHTSAFTMFATACLIGAGLAATAAAADPDGNWKWNFPSQNGDIEILLTLKADGEKLTGTVSRGDMKTDITDGKFKNDEVSFQVVRERNGQKIISKYNGKVDAEAIKGKIEFEFNGESRSFDWEAKRDKK
jgi:hypothetical protein